MTFTDEDLKLLKDSINAIDHPTVYRLIPALLARLEAAELYCKSGAYKDRMAWKVSKGELTSKIRLMGRKAAGK